MFYTTGKSLFCELNELRDTDCSYHKYGDNQTLCPSHGPSKHQLQSYQRDWTRVWPSFWIHLPNIMPRDKSDFFWVVKRTQESMKVLTDPNCNNLNIKIMTIMCFKSLNKITIHVSVLIEKKGKKEGGRKKGKYTVIDLHIINMLFIL